MGWGHYIPALQHGTQARCSKASFASAFTFATSLLFPPAIIPAVLPVQPVESAGVSLASFKLIETMQGVPLYHLYGLVRCLAQDQEPDFPIETKTCLISVMLTIGHQSSQRRFRLGRLYRIQLAYPEIEPSQNYSSLAEECPSLCYSIVAYAASRIASSQGAVDDRALKHYAQGVRSLADAVNRPATECVTLAALTLLQHDFIFFHARTIETPIEGIYAMIEKQGGLAYLDGAIGHVAWSCNY